MSKVWQLVIAAYIHLTVSPFNAADDLRDSLNVTIVSSPKLGEDTICVNETVNLTCLTDDRVKHGITWYWQDQSKQGTTIAVQATRDEVIYSCKAIDNNGTAGEANVTVVANGTQPVMLAHFYRYMLVDKGSNITLITDITTDLPLLNGSPYWNVSTRPNLPNNAEVNNYTVDGYSSLSLYDLSYHDDTGNYTCTAVNECGMSSVFVHIDIRKEYVKCNDSGKILKPLQDIITVSNQYIQFRCLVQGNLETLDYSVTSYWKIEFPLPSHKEPIYINDNSTDPYRIAIYPTCETCCNFTSQLTILSVPAELDGAKISCVEFIQEIDPVMQQSTATLTVFNTPEVIDSDGEVCVAENDSVSLHCTFNAATMDGATVVVWLKDHSKISGYENDTGPVQGKNNELNSILYIKNFTHEDQGAYTCYCYYNKSVVTSNKAVTSDEATMYVKANCSAKEKSDNKIIIRGAIILAVVIVVVAATVILSILATWHRKKIKIWFCSDSVPVRKASDATTPIVQVTESSPLVI